MMHAISALTGEEITVVLFFLVPFAFYIPRQLGIVAWLGMHIIGLA